MTPAGLQRMVWLAAITLIAGVAALALARRDAGGNTSLPRSIPVPGTTNGYYTARVAPYGPTEGHRRTACGPPLTEDTQGIAHPVLPCGVKVDIRFRGRDVLTEVVDRGPNVPGLAFALTKALADRLDLHGTQTVKWRYAR